MQFYIDVLDANNVRLGSGPITSASGWQSTARMDRAGSFNFTIPASDEKAMLIQEKRRVRCMAYLSAGWTEIGNGIIDAVETTIGNDGTASLVISGQDMLYELAGYSAGYASIASGGDAIGVQSGLNVLRDVAANEYGSAWTFDYSQTSINPSVYALLQGESLLTAVGLVAEGRYHFRLGGTRRIDFFDSWIASGVRAIRANGSLAAETCAITSLRRSVETHDLFTRIVPFGSGQGHARLTLAASDRSMPSGYTGSMSGNYLQRTAAVADYGRIDRWVEFKGIGPIDNTDLDVRAAANALFYAAKAHLDLYSQRATHYALSVLCEQVLLPGQTIRLDYRDVRSGLIINQDLYIIEATIAVDTNGIRTTSLVVSDQGRWPVTDSQIIANRLSEARVYQAHPQLNANSYVTGYTKNIDTDESAAFRFRIGAEVTQLQQILFEFQILPFESTVKNIASASTTTDSGGGSTESSTTDGSHSHTYTYTIPGHNHTYTYTIPGHSHTFTYTIPAHSHTFTYTIPAHGHTFTYTIPAHTHTITIADHDHGIVVYGVATPSDNPLARIVYFEADNNRFVAAFGVGSDESDSTEDGGGATVVASRASSTAGSTTQSTSASSSANSTTQLSQTATGGTTAAVSQTTASASSTALSQTATGATTTGGGTHSHTVTILPHSHSVTAALSTIYGIFRESPVNTYDVEDLEYRVNSGSWLPASAATLLTGGWYRLDITSLVMDSTTFRPLQANNMLEIRSQSFSIISIGPNGALSLTLIEVDDIRTLEVGDSITISGTSNYNGTYTISQISGINPNLLSIAYIASAEETSGSVVLDGKTATIDAQLSVRSVIQAVAYL